MPSSDVGHFHEKNMCFNGIHILRVLVTVNYLDEAKLHIDRN